MLKEGDICLNPKKPDSLVCVIIAIKPERGREYFVLAPMTTRGWPSTDQTKWQYRKIDGLERMKQAKKYPHLLTCPECKIKGIPGVAISNIRSAEFLHLALRKKDVYTDEYQCKRCKKWFGLAGLK